MFLQVARAGLLRFPLIFLPTNSPFNRSPFSFIFSTLILCESSLGTRHRYGNNFHTALKNGP